jgi:hypothetical protein
MDTASALSAVDGLGLSMDEMLWAIGVVNAFVVGFAVSELAEREWRHPPADPPGRPAEPWAAAVVPYLQSIVASGRYPLVSRMVIGAEDFPGPDAVFRLAAGPGPRRPGRRRPGPRARAGAGLTVPGQG